MLGTLGLCLAMGVVFVPVVRPLDVASAAPASATDVTRIPHYFGPYPNWANSPQALANAVVTITGGGGTGAEAVANVLPKNTLTGAVGSVGTITVTNPGSGYTSAPTVAITSAGNTQTITATATAQIANGAISSIDVVNNGVGYTEPLVAIAGAPGAGATAQATGGVDVDLTLSSGGTGYAINPVVEFSTPEEAWGRTAMGIATMTDGVVDSVTLTDPGSGYRKAPTVRITDAGAVNATAATVTATINVNRIDVTAAGSAYVNPVVTITDKAPGTGAGATATAALATGGAVTGITVTNPGAGYLTPGLKKFVDTLAGFDKNTLNTLGEYIPIAVPDKTTYPGTDYYEIALVQYRQKFHSSLQPSLLRGYVQLSTALVPGAHTQLTNASVNPAVPDAPIAGYFGVDRPHYLGPTIVAEKDRPVRILFRN
ncbi:MAG TPA: hypothetical protein VH761_02100, partial [Ilumatobacteraceae bacterium]